MTRKTTGARSTEERPATQEVTMQHVTESHYVCPQCGEHAVRVTQEGFASGSVKVSRCLKAPEWIVASVVPVTELFGWTPIDWSEVSFPIGERR